jgi:single-strand DNA-binding protein
MMNKAFLIGRVGKDPDVKYTDNGNAVATFRLATSEKFTNSRGDKVENTEWHAIVAWKKLAEVCEKYVKKGDLLTIVGRIKTRQWDDKDGTTRYTTEIICDELKMLGTKNTASGEKAQESKASQPQEEPVENPIVQDDGEDDLPF